MNDQDKNPEMETWIDPELEARVVAWVAGEASPFEIAELERLCAEKPELAVFKRRIEAVHGLVAEAARPDAQPLVMSTERRTKLLATLGGAAPAEKNPMIVLGAKRRQAWWQQWGLVGTAAAAAAAAFVLAWVGTQRTYQRSEVKADLNRRLPQEVQIQGVVDNSISTAEDLVTAEKRRQRAAKGDYKVSVARSFDAPAASTPAPATSPALIAGLSLRNGVAEKNLPPPQNFTFYDAPKQSDAQVVAGTDVVKMERFVVEGSKDLGYLASNTGTGLRALAPVTPAFPSPPPIHIQLSDQEHKDGNEMVDRLHKQGNELVEDARSYNFGREVNGGASGGASYATISSFGSARAAAPAPTLEMSGSLQQPRVATDLAVSGSKIEARDDANVQLSPFEVTTAPKTSFGGFSAGYGGRLKADGAAGTVAMSGPPAPATFGDAPASAPVDANQTTRGYVATNTLSGTRLNTELKDAAGSVSVTSKLFLDDAQAWKKTKEASDAPVNGYFPPATPDVHAGGGGRGGVRGQLQSADKRTAGDQGALQKAQEEKRGAAMTAAVKEADDAKRRAPAPPAEPPSIEETSTAKEPISTFSLHVSDVSFRLAQAALARGQAPDPTQMRPEEIYNAFDYADPSPTPAEKVGARIEQAAHPFLQQRNLVRIAMKVAATGRAATQPLRLTVLLDTSGSMEREDRVATVRRAMEVLVSLLGERDRIALIGFARQPRLLAEELSGAQARSLLDLIARTPAEGGTNLEEALKLAGELARRHQTPGSQNRIVLLTDGAANLGDADPGRLAGMVETLRQQGIAFDACGVGLNGLDDAMLEPLTRKGDGRYYVLDSPEAADAGFARQLAGAFRPAAENVKVQVRFNPARVANYRLIGFEQHRLRTEDFRNDKVDAAELAAEEAAVALYQVEPLPQGEGELGEVFVRFRDPATGQMVERSWTMPYEARAAAFDRASPSMQLAGAAALVAEKLRASPLAGQFKLGDLAGVMNGLRTRYPDQARVQEFVTMYGQMRRIANE